MNRLEFINHLSHYYADSLQHFIDIICSAGFPEGLLSTDLPPNRNFSKFVMTCRGLALSQRKVIFQALTKDKPNSNAFRLLAESNISNFADALTALRGSVIVKEQEEDEFKTPCFEIYIDPGNAPRETIQEVLEAVSDLHCAAGGLGLEFFDADGFIYAKKKVSL